MKNIALKLGATVTAMMPAIALAQPSRSTDDVSGILETGNDLENLLATIRDWFFTIFMIVAVIFLIWAAFLYLTAAGNDAKVSKAKTALIYSIVAIAVALLAGGLTSVIQNILEQRT